jgi:hypothetical protein
MKYTRAENKARDIELAMVKRRVVKRDLIDGVPRTKMPEYKIWAGMLSRCSNKASTSFENYGGRGIVVCGRWQQDFKNFFEDLGPRPTPKHSIDRIDNDGDYEPGNVRWATKTQQLANQRPRSLDGSYWWSAEDTQVLRHMWEKYYEVEQIASVLGRTVGTVRLRVTTLHLRRSRSVLLMSQKHPDLIDLLRNDGEVAFMSAVDKKRELERSETKLADAHLSNETAKIMSSAMERNAKMRELRRLGLSLEQVGDRFGLTGERVRQLEEIGFRPALPAGRQSSSIKSEGTAA